MSEDSILKTIKEYIESKNADYAILIDGEWGSGKTYFYKNRIKKELSPKEETVKKSGNSLIKKLKEKCKDIKNELTKNRFIYVSTYGCKNVEEIDKKMFDSIVSSFLPENTSKIQKLIKKGAGSVYNIVSVFKELPSIPKDSIRNLIEILQKQNEKRYILVFDDIERCDMPINELLGYINEFVEHKNMKVIIIANQKEIAKNKLYSNIELKYMIASNKKINVPITIHKKDDIFKKDGVDDDNIDLLELKDRAEKIFGEDFLYNQVKEKLIGTTIYYKPNLKNVLEELIEKMIEDENIKIKIKDNSDKIVRMLEDRKHINIRTLKVIVNTIEKVFLCINDFDHSKGEEDDLEKCKERLLIYIVYATILYKEGCLRNIWPKTGEFDNIRSETVINEDITGFKFIDEILENGNVNYERINHVVELYLKQNKKESPDYNDPLIILENYWEMEDDTIDNKVKQLIEKLEKDQYNKSLYSKIILILLRIEKIGFSKENIKKCLRIMKKNIKENGISEELDEFDIMFINDIEQKKYNNIINPLKDYILEINNSNRKININKMINKKEGWGIKFADYILKNKRMFQSEKEFFRLVDIDNLITCLKKSSTKDFSDFRRTIGTIYNFSNIKDYYKADKENLEIFLKNIEDINEKESENFSKTKKYNIQLLKKELEEIILKLK